MAEEELVALAAARCRSLGSSSPGRARRRWRRQQRWASAMRRYLRVVVLCLACGFCSLLYAFSQLAVSLEEGAGGVGGKPQAAAASWLGGDGRGAGRGVGSAGPAAHHGRSDRYGRFPLGGPGVLRHGARYSAWPGLPASPPSASRRRARVSRSFAADSDLLCSFPSFPSPQG